MKINQNISAVIVNDQLLRNENSLSASVERLSSGLKFNNAKDNPSGMAISFKMQAQINALNRASLNATDGSSMVETIDDAIGEMTEVLQRMRELCVQAANDTNTPEDLEAVQKEIVELKKEVDRISSDTEFNGQKLLDGTLDRRTYVTEYSATGTGNSLFDKITNVIISDEVQADFYNVMVTQAPAHEVVVANAGAGGPTVTKAQEGTVTINGVKAEIKEGMTAGDVYEALRSAGEKGRVKVFAFDTTGNNPEPLEASNLDNQGYKEKNGGYTDFTDRLTFVSKDFGPDTVSVACSSTALENLLGLAAPTTDAGKDVVIEIDNANIIDNQNYTGQVSKKCEGDRAIITDKSGFEISFEVRGDILVDNGTAVANKEITIETTDLGTLQLQIGANEDQELAVRVPILNTRSLYIDDLNVTERKGADRGIAQADVAISIVSAARSKMGAYENRLDYAISSLDASEENMTNAISRLGDVDMAQEMTEYTNKNVLTQASISVLAQANDLPQQVLSLLQG